MCALTDYLTYIGTYSLVMLGSCPIRPNSIGIGSAANRAALSLIV